MNIGVVIKNVNGYYQVQTDEGIVYECRMRGRLKQKRYSLLVGDKVEFTTENGKEGSIEKILPRKNSLKRPAVANLDQVVLVVAAHEPDINELLLNKLLVMIEHSDIPLVLCINKWDLKDDSSEGLAEVYRAIGYPLLTLSTYTGEGIEALREVLQHKLTAFAGPSGVGKSSLLNAVEPAFAFQTGEVSEKIKRGRHTTRHASLYSLNKDSFIMDTPGFSAIDFTDIDASLLAFLFPEFEAYRDSCRFNGCSHTHEPICGVKEAVEEGRVHKGRYDSYLAILNEMKEKR